MRLRPTLAALVTTTLISGCAAPTHRTVWVNPNYATKEAAQAAFSHDKAECNARAYQIYGEYRSNLPEQHQQQISGMYRNSQGGLGFYDGTVTSGRNPTPFEAFMDGQNRGDHMAARREYAEACMSRLGWQERHIPIQASSPNNPPRAVWPGGSSPSTTNTALTGPLGPGLVLCRYGSNEPYIGYRTACLDAGGTVIRER
jgi:hypothetical protein